MDKRHSRQSQRSMMIGVATFLLVAIVGATLLAFYYFRPFEKPKEDPDQLAEQAQEWVNLARTALHGRDFQQAEKWALAAVQAQSNLDEAWVIAGNAAAEQQRFDEALGYYRKVKQNGLQEAVAALHGMGQIMAMQGRYIEAEERFRQILKIDPAYNVANHFMVNVLNLTGRRWESIEYLTRLLQQGESLAVELFYLTGPYTSFQQRQTLHRAVEQGNGGWLIQLGLGRMAWVDGDFDQALKHLQKASAAQPQELEIHLLRGRIYSETAFPQGWLDWFSKLPDGWKKYPDAWLVIGDQHQQAELRRVAIRCYWEALKLDPNHRPALARISRLLQLEGQSVAEKFLTRSQQLAELATLSERNQRLGPDFERMKRMLVLLESLGRIWEAAAWLEVANKFYPGQFNASTYVSKWQPIINTRPPLVLDAKNPAKTVDLSGFPLPDWDQLPAGQSSAADETGTATPLVLRDVASQVGLTFEYFNGVNFAQMDQLQSYFIFHVTGGGIGVLDYDLDGWPDVYVSQGTSHPTAEEDQQPTDRLFRNLGNGRFEDVTLQAGLGDQRFGQGVSCGDYDNDGWPDLYVCNFGKDRLYQNQGDGTFRDVTDLSGLGASSWSTSAAIVDLDGDRLPDLYVASYVEGEKIFEPCYGDNRRPQSCHPRKLPAAADHVYRNQGDGRFVEVTQPQGFGVTAQRGLGLVVGRFENQPYPNIFVANDTTANFYFEASPEKPDHYQETAVFKGVAADKDGALQACMGIAVDDVDGDGRVDLFVTNFFQEANAFYCQVESGLYLDEATRFGLHHSSLPMLGFGTQFFDCDLDGWPDLFVANGHIDDLRYRGEGFQMRPQLYRNTGQRRFVEPDLSSSGAYFEGEYLGRAVALIDWDRDGKQDLVVQHLDRPLALLDNETQAPDHRFAAFRLTGTDSSRDAFGAIVEFTVGERTITKHLVAGSGYFASNERQILTGLGAARTIDQVVVRWPSGRVDRWQTLAADHAYHLVEGAPPLVAAAR